jgi:DNA-binding response OmpR family regulator
MLTMSFTYKPKKKKLELPKKKKLIHSIPGRGYKIDTEK